MTIESKYLFIASMDVAKDQEDLFNRVYDTEHIPNLLKVPGVISVARYKRKRCFLRQSLVITHITR